MILRVSGGGDSVILGESGEAAKSRGETAIGDAGERHI
jgi:hypothetical protein